MNRIFFMIKAIMACCQLDKSCVTDFDAFHFCTIIAQQIIIVRTNLKSVT